MTDVLLIRHGRTEWNDAGRIQGHRDIPLSDAGRAALAGRRIPAEYRDWRAVTSPLARAAETASLLGISSPAAEPRLRELNYGTWEGLTRAEVGARDGEEARAAVESRGQDFRAPGGESVRELMARLLDWLHEIDARGVPTVAVTHKGVIRVALALACDWDLVSRAPVRLDWTRGHHFAARGSGELRLVRANVALEDA